MMRRIGKRWSYLAVVTGLMAFAACGSSLIPGDPTNPGGGGGGGSGGIGSNDPKPKNLVQIIQVGEAFAVADLMDLEFLPEQSGEAIVISKSGTVFYLAQDFSILSETVEIPVEDGGERGLLGVVADPNYGSNRYVYFYYTAQGVSPDLNRVERYAVFADTDAGTFSLEEPHLIIQFSKSDSPNPASNHNGGALFFDAEGNLLIGVGDGGGGASSSTVFNISQDLELRLGKVHRVVPDPGPWEPSPSPGAEHFTLPSGQEADGPENVSTPEPSIYLTGVRNPLTTAAGNSGEFFIGDVGLEDFEEINRASSFGQNFGWPECEGPCETLPFRDPIHGYAHDEESFFAEDPDLQNTPIDGDKSVMVLTFYQGPRYNGLLANHLIYADFYDGWIRALKTDGQSDVIDDFHLGHQAQLTSLQTHPVDGYLYGISLGSEQVLRIELVP